MSPSESQLRAALHEDEGKGDGVDAGLVISHARRVQRERRRRRTQLVGATLVVGVVGAGFTLLVGSGNSEEGGSSSGLQAGRNTGSTGGAGGRAAPPAAAGSSAAASRRADGSLAPAPGNYADFAAGCPRVPDRIALPEGVTRDDASGPLLPSDAAAIRVCAYPSGTRSRTVVLRSAAATSLASTVNAATITPAHSVRTCRKDDLVGTVELLALDGRGRRAKPVLVTVACPETVATNGTATRYFAVAPKPLSNLLR